MNFKQMKKKLKKVESVKKEEVACEIECSPIVKIVKLTVDLGREDLNLLRDKINEIIKSK